MNLHVIVGPVPSKDMNIIYIEKMVSVSRQRERKQYYISNLPRVYKPTRLLDGYKTNVTLLT